jgi:hypothetical protein
MQSVWSHSPLLLHFRPLAVVNLLVRAIKPSVQCLPQSRDWCGCLLVGAGVTGSCKLNCRVGHGAAQSRHAGALCHAVSVFALCCSPIVCAFTSALFVPLCVWCVFLLHLLRPCTRSCSIRAGSFTACWHGIMVTRPSRAVLLVVCSSTCQLGPNWAAPAAMGCLCWCKPAVRGFGGCSVGCCSQQLTGQCWL